MTRILLLMVVLGGCVGTSTSSPRWPDHRKQHDTQLDELRAGMQKQEQAIDILGERIAKLEAALKAATATSSSM
jgi:hypothetical protein